MGGPPTYIYLYSPQPLVHVNPLLSQEPKSNTELGTVEPMELPSPAATRTVGKLALEDFHVPQSGGWVGLDLHYCGEGRFSSSCISWTLLFWQGKSSFESFLLINVAGSIKLQFLSVVSCVSWYPILLLSTQPLTNSILGETENIYYIQQSRQMVIRRRNRYVSLFHCSVSYVLCEDCVFWNDILQLLSRSKAWNQQI